MQLSHGINNHSPRQAKTHVDSSAELADNPVYLHNGTGNPALYVEDSRLSVL